MRVESYPHSGADASVDPRADADPSPDARADTGVVQRWFPRVRPE